MIKRWWQFLKERHEPFGISLMVLSYFGANAAMAWNPDFSSLFTPPRALAGYVLIWLVFLHMRLFDEVKDYQFDLQHNPERPLARGLIPLMEFGTGTFLCILLEGAIAANLGWPVFSSYSILLAFTLLMRMEFFIGDWLRPKLEAYAISHTFSATLQGFLIYSIVSNQHPVQVDYAFLFCALGNWFIFNVFEFGRKTFGRDEEKCQDDSYSYRLGPTGAVILLVVNLVIGFVLLYEACLFKFHEPVAQILGPCGVLTGMVVLSGSLYAMTPTAVWGKRYRGVVTIFLLAYHIAIAAGCFAIFK